MSIVECITSVTCVMLQAFSSTVTHKHTYSALHPLLQCYLGITGASWNMVAMHTKGSCLFVSKPQPCANSCSPQGLHPNFSLLEGEVSSPELGTHRARALGKMFSWPVAGRRVPWQSGIWEYSPGVIRIDGVKGFVSKDSSD